MAEPVALRVPLDSPSVPVAYALAGTGELDIKSLVTTYDGSSASDDFYPVMSIYTSDGLLLSRTRTSDVIFAGDSGVVTFAPFLRKAAAAAAATAQPSARMDRGSSTLTSGVVSEPNWASFEHQGEPASGDYFSAATVAGHYRLFTEFSGLYLVTARVEWATAFAGTRYIEISGPNFSPATPLVRQTGGTGSDCQCVAALVNISGGTYPTPIQVFVRQDSGVNQDFTSAQLAVLAVGQP